MSKPVRTAAIVYGFSEGAWHGKRFRHQLRKHGYSVIKEIKDADVIIAHSAGSFYIPHPLRDDQLLLLINPPYWPETSLTSRGVKMTVQIIKSMRPANQPFYHAHKTARNVAYLIRHPRTNKFIASRAKTFNLEQEVKHTRTILVRNSNDPWLTPQLEQLHQLNTDLTIHRLSGDHDDCWLHPERYIDLLQ